MPADLPPRVPRAAWLIIQGFTGMDTCLLRTGIGVDHHE